MIINNPEMSIFSYSYQFIFLQLLLCIFLFLLSKNKNVYISNYIVDEILRNYNVSENDWCVIEKKTYLSLFFLCLNRIPKISIL